MLQSVHADPFRVSSGLPLCGYDDQVQYEYEYEYEDAEGS